MFPLVGTLGSNKVLFVEEIGLFEWVSSNGISGLVFMGEVGLCGEVVVGFIGDKGAEVGITLAGDDDLTGLKADLIGSKSSFCSERDVGLLAFKVSVMVEESCSLASDDVTAGLPPWTDAVTGVTDAVEAIIGDTVATGGEVKDLDTTVGNMGEGITKFSDDVVNFVNAVTGLSSKECVRSISANFRENFGVCDSISLEFLSFSLAGKSIDFDLP